MLVEVLLVLAVRNRLPLVQDELLDLPPPRHHLVGDEARPLPQVLLCLLSPHLDPRHDVHLGLLREVGELLALQHLPAALLLELLGQPGHLLEQEVPVRLVPLGLRPRGVALPDLLPAQVALDDGGVLEDPVLLEGRVHPERRPLQPVQPLRGCLGRHRGGRLRRCGAQSHPTRSIAPSSWGKRLAAQRASSASSASKIVHCSHGWNSAPSEPAASSARRASGRLRTVGRRAPGSAPHPQRRKVLGRHCPFGGGGHRAGGSGCAGFRATKKRTGFCFSTPFSTRSGRQRTPGSTCPCPTLPQAPRAGGTPFAPGATPPGGGGGLPPGVALALRQPAVHGPTPRSRSRSLPPRR